MVRVGADKDLAAASSYVRIPDCLQISCLAFHIATKENISRCLVLPPNNEAEPDLMMEPHPVAYLVRAIEWH